MYLLIKNEKILLFIVLSLTSCKQEEKVVLKEDFVFSYSDGIRLRNLKFTNDTLFITSYYPNENSVYYYELSPEDKNNINLYLDSISKIEYEEEYIQDNIYDAVEYQFQFLDRNKLIYVYGNYYNFELKELNRLAEFIIISNNKKFIEINSSDNFKLENIYWNKYVHFGNVENFFPPEPYPYDSIQ